VESLDNILPLMIVNERPNEPKFWEAPVNNVLVKGEMETPNIVYLLIGCGGRAEISFHVHII